MARWWFVLACMLATACGGGSSSPDASADAAGDAARATCRTSADCDDGLFCNGAELCDPDDPLASPLGCVAFAGEVCGADEVCDEASDECRSNDCADPDRDGDGRDDVACGGDDCDDTDPNRFPGNVEVCDAEGHDEDCDPTTFGTRDADADGYVDARCCDTSAEPATCGTDCDDAAADRQPGLVEACDGKDNDCDTSVDEGLELTFYRDADGDGFGDPGDTRTGLCTAPDGYVALGTDCDDTLPSRNPSAPEVCDSRDNDCDDTVDEDTVDVPWYLDADGDGWGGGEALVSCAPVPDRVQLAGDCDDGDSSRNPSASDDCDGVDDDCDGSVDEAVTSAFYRDADGDGFGDPATETQRCGSPEGYVANGSDCDDGLPGRNPGAPETCDRIDNDCDMMVDESAGLLTLYRDADGDGFGRADVTIESCGAVAGYVAVMGDCDDDLADRNPGAPEVCDTRDNDCDTTVDEGASVSTYYPDLDGDGFGTANGATEACVRPTNYVAVVGDCDDTLPSRNPGAPETCDGVDNDCDTTVDEETSAVSWYLDSDGDGWGTDTVSAVVSCEPVTGRVAVVGDCDDTRADRNPSAPEVCDRIDNDCNDVVDEGVERTFYQDADGDAFGDASVTVTACEPPTGFVVLATDCDDTNAARNPGNGEACDAVTDNDCNPATNPFDADMDGVDDSGCGGTDCNDLDGTVYPGAAEICDRKDNRCLSGGGARPEEDADLDGYAPDGPCSGGPILPGDCDDTRAASHEGAPEVCDGADNDCDSSTDEDPAATNSCNPTGTTGACIGGTCTIVACTAPWRNCDGDAQNGCEANLETDEAHCDGCNQACPTGATCTGRLCLCPSESPDVCGGACTDRQTDAANCGTCGNVCPGGGACVDGICECPVGQTLCGSECVDVNADVRHCGACDATCFGGSCEGGSCVCGGAMPEVCDGVCKDLANDTANCGACGDTCTGGSCESGSCVCGSGEMLCDGACVDVLTNTANCGSCGNDCGAGGLCTGGVCDRIIDIDVGGFWGCALRDSGRLTCWGSSAPPARFTDFDDITSLDGGGNRVMYTRGTAPWWGGGGLGPLQQGPDPVGAYAAGGVHFCAADATGQLYCWGGNSSGQVGDGSTWNQTNPVMIAGMDDVTDVACDGNGTCAIQAGALYCWGSNGLVYTRTPEEVTSITDVVEIGGGERPTCVRHSTGRVSCNGIAAYDGGTADASGWADVGLTGATKISAGVGHACAIVTGGELYCWGYNNSGQVGDGTFTNRDAPVRILADRTIVDVDTSDRSDNNFTCALDDTGEVWCWGDNWANQLGDPDLPGSPVPVLVDGV